MATGLVIHISSGEDKHTEVLMHERIRIGSCDDCDLRLRMSDLPKRPDSDGVVLELARLNGSYRVTAFDSALELTHNGQPLEKDTPIVDGDELQIRPTNLSLQFFPIRSLPASFRGEHVKRTSRPLLRPQPLSPQQCQTR